MWHGPHVSSLLCIHNLCTHPNSQTESYRAVCLPKMCWTHTDTFIYIYTRVCGVPSVCTNFNIQASFFIYIQSNACFHRFNIHIINNFILCKFCKNFTSCTFSYLHHLFLKFIQHFKDSLIRNLWFMIEKCFNKHTFLKLA